MGKKVYDFEGEDNINKKSEKRSSNSVRTVKILVWFFVIILVSSGLFFVYLEYGHLFRGLGNTDSFEDFAIEYDDYEDYMFSMGNRLIVQSGKDMLAFYDNTSNIKMVENLDMNKPIVKTQGNFTLVYNKNGKKALLYVEYKNQFSINLDGEIFNACVNKNGYMGFVMNDTTFNSKVGIYNQKGQMLYNFNSTNYVLDVDIKDNNRAFSLVTLSDDSGKITSGIRSFNILKASEQWAYVVNDVIISDIEYMSDILITIADDGIRAFEEGNLIWQNLTGDMVFWKYDIGEKYIIMVKTENFGNIVENKNEIDIISKEGSISETINIDGVINGVVSMDNTICIYKDRSIFVYDSNGSLLSELYTDLDIKEIFLTSENDITISFDNHMESRKIR